MADSQLTRDPLSLVVALRNDLRIEPQEFCGQTYYVIEDPLRAKFFRLGSAEFRFLSLLDGRRNLQQAVGLAAEQFRCDALTESDAVALVHWLHNQQLVGATANASIPALSSAGVGKSVWSGWVNPLAIRVPLGCPDRVLDKLLPWTGWLFTWPALAGWLLVVAVAGYLSLVRSERLWEATATLLHPENWLGLLVVWLALKLLHEVGHAVACKRFGASVRGAGLSLLLFAPVAYVDVTPAWRLKSKWKRIIISAAGMYVEVFLAAVALIAWAQTSDPWMETWSRQVFLMAGVQTLLVNANPLQRFDGYYILSDLWEIPNLHTTGRRWWIAATRRVLGEAEAVLPPFAGNLSWLVPCYALSVGIWRVVLGAAIAVVILSLGDLIGRPAAGLLTAAWLTALLLGAVRFGRDVLTNLRLRRIRVAALGGILSALVLAGAFVLGGKATVSAPAIVEYAPLTSIRATTAGFVREICVQDGDDVQAGEALAVLEDEELRMSAEDARRKIRQSEILEQSLGARGELAKRTIEEGRRRAIEVRLHELERQLDSLIVRAPCNGRVVARNLSQLVGQYLSAGAELLVLGSEESKELIVGVRQSDVELFSDQGHAPLRATVVGIGGRSYPVRLVRLEPSGQLVVPHPALSGANGGPIAVLEKQPAAEDPNQAIRQEAIRPIFMGAAALDQADALELRPGQLATVYFVSHDRTTAARLIEHCRHWLLDELTRQ